MCKKCRRREKSFFKKCIRLRRRYELFRRGDFFTEHNESTPADQREIIWQALQPNSQDWSSNCHHLGFLLNGDLSGQPGSPSFFVMVNGSRNDHQIFTVPRPLSARDDQCWARIVDTSADSPADFVDPGEADTLLPGSDCRIEPMAVIILQSKEKMD